MAGAAGIATLLLAFAFSFAHAATAFTVTGIIDVKLTKTVANITATKASADVYDEVFGKNIPYSISAKNTAFYRYVNKKLAKTGIGTVRMGQEVVVKGTKVGGTFKVTSLTINDRSFKITGTVSEVNKDNKTITIGVKTSTYKQKNLKGTDIVTTYSSKTVCMEDGSEIGCSEIDADGQKITVEGGVSGVENVYNLTKVTNKK
jgi:hypothetical protein